MAIRRVLSFPNPILLHKTKPIEVFDAALQILIDDMFETMYAENGIGLAANQVGEPLRLFVRDVSNDKSNPQVFINPLLIETSGEIILQEGCLSFPGISVQVARPEFITIEALDRHGKIFTHSESGYSARCVLHEFDHLEGITMLDRLSPTKRKLVMNQFRERS